MWSHQDLRKQHDEQVSLYKEELEQTFQAKVRDKLTVNIHSHIVFQEIRERKCPGLFSFCPWAESIHLHAAGRPVEKPFWHKLFLL